MLGFGLELEGGGGGGGGGGPGQQEGGGANTQGRAPCRRIRWATQNSCGTLDM